MSVPSATPAALHAIAREIDTHYQLCVTTRSPQQLIDVQRRTLALQHIAAAANIRALADIAAGQQEAVELLSYIDSGIYEIAAGIADIGAGMHDLNAAATQVLHALQEQSEILLIGFSQIADQLAEQQRILSDISSTLRSPYETQALELLREADRALASGMSSSGRLQADDYRDAARLLRLVLDNPIGSRNYVARFQTGWLNWKADNDLPAAERAFYEAARLSRSRADLYYVFSERHRAHIQYLRDQFGDAYQTIQGALNVSPQDPDLLFDAARYAARVGRKEDVLSLLNRCIDLRPTTIVAMFAEKDFTESGFHQSLAALLVTRTNEARQAAASAADRTLKIREIVQRAEQMAECDPSPLGTEVAALDSRAAQVGSADYLTALDIARRANGLGDALREKALDRLKTVVALRRNTITEATQLLAALPSEHQQRCAARRAEYDRTVDAIQRAVSNIQPTGLQRALRGHDIDLWLWLGLSVLGTAFMSYWALPLIWSTLLPGSDTFVRALVAVAFIYACWRGLSRLVESLLDLPANRAASRRAARRDREVHEAALRLESELKALDSELASFMAAAEMRRTQGQEPLKKAESALRWLQQQP